MKEHTVNTYVQQLNSIKSKIRFAYEYEKVRRINLLDTNLSRNDNESIGIRWFRKETASDRLANYYSYHHKAIKQNIISNMTCKIVQTTKNLIEQKE